MSTINLFSQENTFIDSRDGKKYMTIKIGNIVWIAQNMAYKTDTGSVPYKNNENNIKKYGYLYNYEAALKACPDGWHLPSEVEWQQLIDYLKSNQSNKLKEEGTVHWAYNGLMNGNNESEFTALPGGLRDSTDGTFKSITYSGNWWISDQINNTANKCVRIGYYCTTSDIPDRYEINKTNGLSIRCIKN